MKQLVFLEPNKIDAIPFTTSDVIAEHAKVSHHAVRQMISKHEGDIKEFGVLAFEMRKPPRGSVGGRPETVFCLNEGQATLLVTYLKNTEPVRRFKKELVRQFFAMRTELMLRRDYRAELKPIRRGMTDVIKAMDPGNKWAYKQYTDLAYSKAVGKTAAQLRRERNAPKKAVAVDYMTSEELHSVAIVENQIAVLRQMGMDYYQIKQLLNNALVAKGA